MKSKPVAEEVSGRSSGWIDATGLTPGSVGADTKEVDGAGDSVAGSRSPRAAHSHVVFDRHAGPKAIADEAARRQDLLHQRPHIADAMEKVRSTRRRLLFRARPNYGPVAGKGDATSE